MLVGITGTTGSGKGTVAEYLHKKHGFVYLSVHNFFAGEVVRNGKMVTPQTLAAAAREVRAAHGNTYPIEQLLLTAPNAKRVVVESLRTIEEANFLKAHGDELWCIDADQRVRYQRTMGKIMVEAERPSFEEWAKKDAEDVASLKEVCAAAQKHIDTTSDNLDLLHQEVDRLIH